MRRLMVLLVVMAVAGCGDGDATETGATEQFTQGGVSMEPTVRAGQVITARTVTGTYEPRRGDVVLFRSPGGLWGDRKVPLLKRVVAVGGETIACCDTAGKVTVDGKPLDEPYVAEDASLDRGERRPTRRGRGRRLRLGGGRRLGLLRGRGRRGRDGVGVR